jgi:hypothetical protein
MSRTSARFCSGQVLNESLASSLGEKFRRALDEPDISGPQVGHARHPWTHCRGCIRRGETQSQCCKSQVFLRRFVSSRFFRERAVEVAWKCI